MKRLYGDTVSVEIGDVVKVFIPKKQKKSHKKLDPVGVVLEVNEETKAVLVLTRHGLIGQGYRKKKEFFIDASNYEVINGMVTISDELETIRKQLKSKEKFDRSELPIISMANAHSMEYHRM